MARRGSSGHVKSSQVKVSFQHPRITRGPARHVRSAQDRARQVSARRGKSSQGLSFSTRALRAACSGASGPGTAWRGWAGRGNARQVKVSFQHPRFTRGEDGRVTARPGGAGRGKSSQGHYLYHPRITRGLFRRGLSGRGMAGQVKSSQVKVSVSAPAHYARRGSAGPGTSWRGRSRLGVACQVKSRFRFRARARARARDGRSACRLSTQLLRTCEADRRPVVRRGTRSSPSGLPP